MKTVMTIDTKNAIKDALAAYCDNYPSRNRAAESLGISSSYVSQILNGKYDAISEEMFARLARLVGYSADGWQITESQNLMQVAYVLSDAQLYKNVTWIVGDAGCGKTTSAINYRKTHNNVFYILCSEDMRRGDFVKEIARQVGAPADGTSLRDTLQYALNMISYLDNPLLIFDEGDKLTDAVLNYFISIYNRLEGRCGIVFMSTDYIQRRMEAGLRLNKKGYKEINSRIGRKFFKLSPTSQTDIHGICVANGLDEDVEIKRVLRDAQSAENDLRRVKRIVHARKRIEEEKKGGKQ